jgi:anti-sigma factor RsiW
MVSETHPDEIQLLDYVEGDLDTASRGVVEAHLAGCAECAEQISRLEAGREALRGAPMLEAPVGLLGELPEQARPARRTFRPGRALAILAPVAAIAGVVAIVATTNPGGGDQSEEAGRAAATMAAGVEEGGGEEGAPTQALDAAVVRSVAGPPNEVVQVLLAKGLDARRLDDRVEVRGTTRERVEVALADRPNGPVAVVIAP